MLLLHLGIPPSGHGYAPPIAVAKITVLAKKGLSSAELHLRVYYSYRRLLSKKLSVNGEKTVPSFQPPQKKHDTSPALRKERQSLSCRRNGAATIGLRLRHYSPFFEICGIAAHTVEKGLEHSGSGFITSFSCTACHALGGVFPYTGNHSCCSCRRCGQSGRGCLLLNIRLPE